MEPPAGPRAFSCWNIVMSACGPARGRVVAAMPSGASSPSPAASWSSRMHMFRSTRSPEAGSEARRSVSSVSNHARAARDLLR